MTKLNYFLGLMMISVSGFAATPPLVDNIAPLYGSIGTTVTMQGKDFSKANLNYVRFGKGLLGPYNSTDGSSLQFVIPPKAMGGCHAPSFAPVHCLAILIQETTPGNYPLSIVTPDGESNSITFKVQ